MNNKFKVGDLVTRRKYNNDILFRIVKITDNNIILNGVDLRLYADSDKDDLVLSGISKKKDNIEMVRSLDTKNYFFIPGVVLHIDADKNYLTKCSDYYKEQKIKYFGYVYDEEDIKSKVNSLIEKHKPNIVVITGHDAYYKNNKYKNSKYYIDSVSEIRKKYNDIVIIAGACQSDFEGLIKAGASFASSPAHINIHALDPAIIASFVALSNINEEIDLEEVLSKTKYGSDGIGGFKINGTMKIGYPRNKGDKN